MSSRIIPVLAVLAAISTFTSAEPHTVARTVRYVMGENESRQAAREQALREAKRQALEEAGVFIESAMFFNTSEGTGRHTNENEFANDLQQVTAGVTMTEVTKEEWKTEGNAVVLYMACKVTVDPQDVRDRINKALESRRRLGTTSRVENDVDRLKAEIEDLKKRTQTMPTNNTAGFDPGIPPPAASTSGPLASARALYDRGLYAEALQSVTEHIDRHADDPEARILRGQVYAQMKGRYAMAVRDLETAIRLQPHSVQARIVLADIHRRFGGNKAEARRLLEDALLLAPGNQDAARMLRAVEK